MGGTFTQVLAVLGILRFMLRADDQIVKVTEELLRQHEAQRSQEMAWLLEMEQHSQEMAWLLDVEQMSQELPEIAEGSLLLWACQHWWFWALADLLLVLFGFYWLPRQGSSGHRETPAACRRKRRSRRKRIHVIADYSDKLDLYLKWNDMPNSEERMKGMINASAKPFPQETFGQSCIQGIH